MVYNAEAAFNMPARDVKLVAQWTANAYTVTFDVNGDEATCDTASSSFPYDQPYGTLPVPTRTGYTFTGWTGTDVSTANQNLTIPTGSIGNRTYTANWMPISYTISYTHMKGSSAIDIASGVSNLVSNWSVESDDVTANDANGTLRLTLPTPRYETQQYSFADYSGTGITKTDSGYQLTVAADSDNTQIAVTVNWTENETKLTIYSGTTGDGKFFESMTAGAKYDLSNTVEVDGTTYYIPGWVDRSGNKIYTSETVTVEEFTTKTYRPIAVTEIPVDDNINTTYTYDIYTGDQLKSLAEKLKANCTYVFNLEDNIILTDWTTGFVFSEYSKVNVTFNGNDRSITFGEGCTAPLFAFLTDASFSNLTTTGTIDCGDDYASALVEKLTQAGIVSFTNCTNEATISGFVVGGLVGHVSDSKTELSFTGCTNSGNLTGTGNTGGLLGYNIGSSSSMQFTNCTNTGNITTAAGSYVGGLVGSTLGKVTAENCTVSGVLTGKSNTNNSNGFVGNCSSGFTSIGTNTDNAKRAG